MAVGRLRSLRVQEIKSSGWWLGHHLEVGGRSPGRVPGLTPQGLLPFGQVPLHVIRAGLALPRCGAKPRPPMLDDYVRTYVRTYGEPIPNYSFLVDSLFLLFSIMFF